MLYPLLCYTRRNSFSRNISRVQKHAHRLLRISTSYNRFENCLRLSTPRKTSSRAFFPLQDCSKFKSRKRWKKKKDRFDRFSRIECVYIHRSQIQFGHRPNTNCPNEAAYYRVLASSGNLIMMPTIQLRSARPYFDGSHLLNPYDNAVAYPPRVSSFIKRRTSWIVTSRCS